MTIIYLPDELLESIFSYIHDKTSEPTPLSQRSFTSLALTSKRFLPLARSYLYYRPICPSSPSVTWDGALALASSISSPLGSLVVSLEGIVEFITKVGALPEPQASLPFQLRGFTKTFSLYFKIIQSCTRLILVELIFNSNQHCSKLLKALEGSIPTLKTVKFANASTPSDYLITEILVYSALNYKEQPRNIENLIVSNVYLGLGGEPCLKLNLKSLAFEHGFDHRKLSKVLYSQNSASLESFSVKTRNVSLIGTKWIVDYLPSTLRKFNISINIYARLDGFNLDDYLINGAPFVTSSALSRLTSLTHFSIEGFHGPSLDLLDILASSSPAISVLNFARCHWLPSSSQSSNSAHRIVSSSIPSIVDSSDLLAQLRKFKHLKRVHLGFLPTTKVATYASTVSQLEEQGVEVEKSLCFRYPRCRDCGERH